MPYPTLPNAAYFFKRANQRLCLLKKRRSFNVSKQAMIMVQMVPLRVFSSPTPSPGIGARSLETNNSKSRTYTIVPSEPSRSVMTPPNHLHSSLLLLLLQLKLYLMYYSCSSLSVQDLYFYTVCFQLWTICFLLGLLG